MHQNGADPHSNGAGLEGLVPSNGAATDGLNLVKRWRELPSQYQLVFAASVAFVICNMVRPHPSDYLDFSKGTVEGHVWMQLPLICIPRRD